MGLSPCLKFNIKLINLDRFVKRDGDEFNLDGSNPPEEFLSELYGEGLVELKPKDLENFRKDVRSLGDQLKLAENDDLLLQPDHPGSDPYMGKKRALT